MHNGIGLDPARFISLPQLAQQGMMKTYGKPIESLSDAQMYLTAEAAIRGGFSAIPKRHARKTLENYLLYLDANNLYGWAMC